jgi:predicted NBD/HSP70 family sugar kinase/DNA-binding transcriptional ArsR family regulator
MALMAGSSRLLRAMNESAALTYLLERGPLTRSDLRELTGLSKPTVSDALRRLTDAGLATVVGRVSAGPGPNAEVYSANPAAGYALALSLREGFGSDIPVFAGAVCDFTGTVRGRVDPAADLPVVAAGTAPVYAIAAAVRRVCAAARISERRLAHIRIGVPGSYDPHEDTINHIDVPGWGQPGLVGRIRDHIGVDVTVDNDVNLAAIAERRHGVARDVNGFTLLWLADGLGLAIDLDGTLLRGARGAAGEIGYVPLTPTVPASGCRPDLQSFLGGPAVLALAGEHGCAGSSAAEAVRTAAASQRNGAGAGAAAFLAELADRIALATAAVVAVLDPPLVVLAGDVARAGGESLRAAVAASMRHAAPLTTTVAVTAIEDDAVLVGGLHAALASVRDARVAGLMS